MFASHRLARLLHCPARSYHSVGPPDPRSNLRPLIYEEDASPQVDSTRHPYSLREFTKDAQARDYQLKLERQRLDAFNHAFWANSNSRFEAAKQLVLDDLPSPCTSLQREAALSEFYKHWLAQDTDRHREYTAEWRQRNWSEVLLATRVEYQAFKERVAQILSLGSEEHQDKTY